VFHDVAEVEGKLAGQRRRFVADATTEGSGASEADADGVVRFQPPRTPRWRNLLSVALVFPLQSMQLGFGLFGGAWYFVPALRMPLLGYLAYMFLDASPARGGWRSWPGFGALRMWLRDLSIWKWAASYYPTELVKTADLDPAKSYVFGYHPHGLIGAGACATFGCNAVGFDTLYRGVDVTLMTLNMTFWVPFFRDWILAHGIGSCNRATCLDLLRGGRSIALVIGGAKEALDARPGVLRCYIRRRQGFVRVAVETGAGLVPALGIGENDLFHQLPNPRGSIVRRLQDTLQAFMKFSMPVCYGRTLPPFLLPTVPLRRKITVVVGAPIFPPAPEAREGLSDDEVVEKLHTEYMAAMELLYKKHAPAGGPPLELV